MASGDDPGSAKSETSIPIELETADTITYVNWIIKDFDTLYEACAGDILKQFAHLKFEAGTNFGIKIKGIVYFSRGSGDEGYLDFSLRLSSSCPEQEERILASYSVSVEDNEGDLDVEARTAQWPLSNYKYGLHSSFRTISEIRQYFLKEGVLTVRLTVKLHESTKELINDRDTNCKREIMNRNLAKGFEGLFVSEEFSDVTFTFPNELGKNKDQEQMSGSGDAAVAFPNGESAHQEIEMKAHKVVLCVQSPVFAAMFLTQMKERITGKVIIEDISAKAFKKVLEFIYAEQLTGDWDSVADELMYAADKYELINLKYVLEDYIQDIITVNNAIKLRKMAKLCNFKTVKNEVELYVKDHFTEFLNLMEN